MSTIKKIAVITGGGGLLARCMAHQLSTSGWLVNAFTHAELDITDESAVRSAIQNAQPFIVINGAATPDVDRCEGDPEWAFSVNERGPRFLARACRSQGAQLVHVSTDYVFDGSKDGFYTQAEEPAPLSVYGKSKLAGERAVQEELERSYVIRSSWIFGAGGKNFGSRVVDYARAGAPLKGVVDQISIPTYAPDLASRIQEIIETGTFGLYHATSSGPSSWFDFARVALDLVGLGSTHIEPIRRAELNQAAPRPRNSAMACLLSPKLGLQPLRQWREGLEEFANRHLRTPAASSGFTDAAP